MPETENILFRAIAPPVVIFVRRFQFELNDALIQYPCVTTKLYIRT